MNKILRLLLSGVMAISCSKSEKNSDELSWEQPDEAFRIGRGYDANAKESVRGDCLLEAEKYLQSSWLDARGIKAQISETRISSKESLYKELNLTSNAKVKYGAFSGGGSYSQYEKFDSSEDSFTWLFSLKAAIGSKTLQTEFLNLDSFKPEAQQLIKAAQSGNEIAKKAFYNMCGTQFIRSVRLGGALTDVLEINAKAAEQVKDISARMKASYGAGNFGVSGKAAFKSIFEKAEKNSFFKREFNQTGGEEIEFDLTDDNVKAVLDKFVRDLKQQNAAVIEVEMADWGTILDFAPSDPVDVARSIRIDQLLRQLWRYQDTLQKIDASIYLHDRTYYEFSEVELAALSSAYTEVSAAIDSIISLGQSCYLDAKTCAQNIKQVIVSLPKPRQKEQDNEASYSTTKWELLFPSDSAGFTFESSPGLKAWRFNEELAGRTLDGSLLVLKVDLFESACSEITQVFTPNTQNIIATFSGEPAYYSEEFRSFPTGKQRYSANFALKSGNECLQLQILSDAVRSSGLSINDGSQLSGTIRRMIASISAKK